MLEMLQGMFRIETLYKMSEESCTECITEMKQASFCSTLLGFLFDALETQN